MSRLSQCDKEKGGARRPETPTAHVAENGAHEYVGPLPEIGLPRAGCGGLREERKKSPATAGPFIRERCSISRGRGRPSQ